MDFYKAGDCQALSDQFHEHFPNPLYKSALAILQRVPDDIRAGMWVLRGGLKVQNHLLNIRVAHRQASWQKGANCITVSRLPGFTELQILRHVVRTGKGKANFLTLQNLRLDT